MATNAQILGTIVTTLDSIVARLDQQDARIDALAPKAQVRASAPTRAPRTRKAPKAVTVRPATPKAVVAPVVLPAWDDASVEVVDKKGKVMTERRRYNVAVSRAMQAQGVPATLVLAVWASKGDKYVAGAYARRTNPVTVAKALVKATTITW